MSDPKAKPRKRSAQSVPSPVNSRPPVHTQPFVGVDADIERINQLGRTARKLLGGKGKGGV